MSQDEAMRNLVTDHLYNHPYITALIRAYGSHSVSVIVDRHPAFRNPTYSVMVIFHRVDGLYYQSLISSARGNETLWLNLIITNFKEKIRLMKGTPLYRKRKFSRNGSK